LAVAERLAAPVTAGLAVGIAFVILFAFFVGNNVIPLQRDYDTAIITLERTICYGACPDYSLTIYGNGTVVYEGHRYVAVTGRQISSIPQEEVKELVDYFHTVGYFSMADEYPCWCADVPVITTSIKLGNVYKKVTDYYYGPAQLKELQDRIDEAAKSDRWVKCQSDQQTVSPDAGCIQV
jgi:hypothetical protein